MLKLSAPSRDLFWLDLGIPGLRTRMRPVTVAMIIVARREASKIFQEEGADQDPTIRTRVTVELVRQVVHAGLAEWEGVAGEDDLPAAVTPENVDKLLSLWPVHDALDRLYVEPALVVVAEGNESSKPPGGTSKARAPSTAAPAV